MKTSTNKLLITTPELQQLLSCGRHTAEWIGREAGARVQIGRSVRWRVKSIEEYLDDNREVIKG